MLGFTNYLRELRMTKNRMKLPAIAATCLLLLTSAAAQDKPHSAVATTLEANVRKVWDAFQKKDKPALGVLLSDSFREVEDGGTGFGDKKTEINLVDELDLVSYNLTDFTVKPLGPDAALVTYMAQYESKSGGQTAKAKCGFGEVWVREGSVWRSIYLQETALK